MSSGNYWLLLVSFSFFFSNEICLLLSLDASKQIYVQKIGERAKKRRLTIVVLYFRHLYDYVEEDEKCVKNEYRQKNNIEKQRKRRRRRRKVFINFLFLYTYHDNYITQKKNISLDLLIIMLASFILFSLSSLCLHICHIQTCLKGNVRYCQFN